jgi:hypothetical protein
MWSHTQLMMNIWYVSLIMNTQAIGYATVLIGMLPERNIFRRNAVAFYARDVFLKTSFLIGINVWPIFLEIRIISNFVSKVRCLLKFFYIALF